MNIDDSPPAWLPRPVADPTASHAANARALNLRSAATLALAVLMVAARLASAATIVVSTQRHGDTIEIRASTPLLATPETAWRVLTAYERYPDFIPDLRTSRVLARVDKTVTVEQTGDARLWLLPVPLDITFEIVEAPPRSLHSQAIAGSLRSLHSSYVLTPAASGVRLDYVGSVAPGFGLFGDLELRAVERNVARQFQALADEIERQADAPMR